MEEKDSQLAAVSREREELRTKLGQLQSLVTKFMSQPKDVHATTTTLEHTTAESQQTPLIVNGMNGIAQQRTPTKFMPMETMPEMCVEYPR